MKTRNDLTAEELAYRRRLARTVCANCGDPDSEPVQPEYGPERCSVCGSTPWHEA